MSLNQPSRSETAEKISILIRIYRAAVRSGDTVLRNATASELKSYGVDIADLMIPLRSERGEQC